jgi:ABC-type nitrate/sulfonate/bicarbonate transport system substrate-binding protein
MKKIVWSIVLVLMGIIVIAFAVNSSKLDEDYVVKIGNIPIIPSKLPLEIAIRKGFFDKVGIKIQVTELQSSNLVSDALVRGDVDITPEISLLPFVTAELVDPGKMKIFSVTDLTTEAPFDSILVKSDSKIASIKDLEGKKIGVFPGSTATNILKLLFKKNGIDYSLIQFIQLPPAQHLTVLSVGSIDALHAYEPIVTIGIIEGSAKKIFGSVYADQLNHNPLGAGLLSAKFLNEHPREAKKAIEAINMANDFMRTNDKETREIAKEIFKFSPEVADAVSIPYYNHSDKIDKNIVEQLVDLFVAGGEIKSKPDLTNLYYR